MNIPQDILEHHLLKALAPRDLFMLRQVNKLYSGLVNGPLIYGNLLREINSRLGYVFGERVEEFKQIMKETKSTVSGPFIIQCILGENINNHIDIFVFRGAEGRIDKIMNDMGFIHLASQLYHIETLYGSVIVRFRDIKDPFDLLWDIPGDINGQLNMVHNMIDLDIEKNMYYFDREGNERVKIFRVNDICDKRIKFQSYKNGRNTIRNYNMYIAQRFVPKKLSLAEVLYVMSNKECKYFVVNAKEIEYRMTDAKKGVFTCCYKLDADRESTQQLTSVKGVCCHDDFLFLHSNSVVSECFDCPLKLCGMVNKHLHLKSELHFAYQKIVLNYTLFID